MYRIKVGDTSYVTDNVWFDNNERSDDLIKIYESDINDNDIVLNSITFIESQDTRKKIINYYLRMMHKEKSKNNREDLERYSFWKYRETIIRLYSDCEQYIYYVIEKESMNDYDDSTYETYVSGRSLRYLHVVGESHLRNEHTNIHMALLDVKSTIKDVMSRYATPFSIYCYDSTFGEFIEQSFDVKVEDVSDKKKSIMWNVDKAVYYTIYQNEAEKHRFDMFGR